MTAVSIAILGHVEVRIGARVMALAPASQVLLGCLALHASDAPMRRERLGELLWPEMNAQSQKSRLRTALWRLKKTLGTALDDVLKLQSDTVHLRAGKALLHKHFEQEAMTLSAVPLDKLTDAEYTRLEAIMAHYTGPLMEGHDADWILPLRETYSDLYCAVLDRQIKYLRAHGRDHESIRSSQELLALDPYREDVHATLIALYGKAGRPGRAVQQYKDCQTLMEEDLGVTTQQARQSLDGVLHSGPSASDLPAILRTLEAGVQDLNKQIRQLKSALQVPHLMRKTRDSVRDKVT